MSNQINAVQKFFEYLSQNNISIDDVKNDADANGDGAIKKSELKKWLENNPELNVTASEMTQIFNLFNTNKGKTKIGDSKVKEKNGLSDAEMNAMADKLAAYQAVKASIDEVFAGNGDIEIPDELQPYIMSARASVEESVLAKMNSNFEIPNMTEVLTIAIAKTGANGLGQALFNQALSDNASVLPAGYAGGDDFQGLLNSYIKSLGSSVDLDSIDEDVASIVDDFFASAGFGVSDIDAGDPLYPYSWKSSMGLNDLQVAVLTKKLTDALGPTAANFANYQADFNDAANGFIKEKLASSNDFDTLNTAFNNASQIAGEFQNSKYYKALQVIVNYTDFSESQHTGSINDLYYEALESNFGADFAKNLSEADVTYKDGELYNTIIRQVMQMVLNGDLTTDDQIRNKIIELIVTNYQQFCDDLGIGSSSASLEDLKNNVDTLYNNGAQLEAVRTAAIAFLNAAHAVGNEQLDRTIKAEFGDNYKDTVNTLRLASVIKNKVSIVMAKYNDLISNGSISTPLDPSTLSADWTVGQIPTLQVGGNVTTLACSATVKDANGHPVSSSTDNAITYAVTTTGGNTGSTVTINSDTGELSMTPGSQNGNLTIKVKVMVNGVEVGTKEISVTVKKAHKPFDKSSAGISTGGIKIDVGGEDLAWAKSRDNAISNFNSTIADKLKASAIAQGYDPVDADNAAKTLKSYFAAAMHALDSFLDTNFGKQSEDSASLHGSSFTYTKYTADGSETVSSSDQSAVRRNWSESDVNQYGDLTGVTAGTGIYIGCDTTATDSYFCFVNGQKMIDLFASFIG